MNDIRKYITILENASEDELQKYRDEVKYWQNEKKKYWPVSPELLAQYRDGSHTKKDRYGSYWRNKNGELHRDGDLPAYIGANGPLEWFQNNKTHRDGDLPAIIYADGDLAWYQNNQLHRDGDKPAEIWANGTLIWCQNGQSHRSRGPARIYSDGALEWWWLGTHIPVSSQEAFIAYLEEHRLTEKTKMITASEAYSISRNKVLETRIPQLEEKIRERAEQGYFKTILTRNTWDPNWGPMIDEIKALGYEVHTISNNPNQILVDWSKR